MNNDPSLEKIDVSYMSKDPKHAVFHTLNGAGLIESYELYRPKDRAPIANDGTEVNLLVCLAEVKFGDHVNGHNGVVHGGILSTVFDDVMGWGCYECMPPDQRLFYTANLSVNFKAPVLETTRVRLECSLQKFDRRKVFIQTKMLSCATPGKKDDPDKEVLYAEATSLYIVPKK